MQDTIKRPYQFGDLAREAGLGRTIWGQTSYLAATYYHYIVGILTALVLLFTLPQRLVWPYGAISISLYLAYVVLRKLLTRNSWIERKFYQSDIQFVRAQLGILGITVLMAAAPGSEQTALWVLYVLLILLTSKHCNTERMLLVAAESCLMLGVVRLWHRAPLLAVLLDADLWADCMGIGLLSFVLHYLVRNVQARDQTIAAHNAVISLAREVDMADTTGAKQWQPMLMALLKHVGGECASTWVCDWKIRRLQLAASVRRDPQLADQFDLSGDATGITVQLDSPALIATVARTGRAANSTEPLNIDSGLPARLRCNPMCSEACIELAVPINVGTSQRQSTLGVLSVGFRPESFRDRLLPDYQGFMQGLVSQAKPMMAYAQRLHELVELQETTRKVWLGFDLEQVLDSILQALVNQLGFEFALISLVDDDRRLIRAVRGFNVPQRWLDMAVHSLESNDIQANIIRTGKSEVIAGWDDRFDRQIWNEFGHADMVRVFMPIWVVDALTRQERIVGTIEAGYHRSNRAEITEDQLRMLEAFKDQVSMAIEHARLLERMQRKADVLASLHSVGRVIAAAGQSSQVLEKVARHAMTLLNADIVMLYRYHRDTQTVDQPVTCGEIGKKYHLNLKLNEENILTHLVRETQPYYSADAHHDSFLLTHADVVDGEALRAKQTFIQRHNIKSFAGIPLVADGETVGIMFVNYRKRHQFDQDEKQVHELVAQQAAFGIKSVESNELMRDLIVREERNHLSRELHHSVLQALFSIAVMAENAMNRVYPEYSEARADLCNILEMAHIASSETGFMVEELRAPVEESRYLVRGLEEYARRIMKWHKLRVVLDLDIRRPLSFHHEQVLMRFAREAINNAVRHSHCTVITVRGESVDNYIRVSVRDDGIGFDPSRVPSSKLGLKSMQELAASVAGTLSISSTIGAGATASLHIRVESDLEEE